MNSAWWLLSAVLLAVAALQQGCTAVSETRTCAVGCSPYEHKQHITGKKYNNVLLPMDFPGVAVKGKDMLWLDTEGAVPVGTTLAFEIKGKSDAMVTIRGKPEVDPQDASPDTPCQTQSCRSMNDLAASQTIPLTVVFGSHRNTKIKICGGKECLLLRKDVSEALLDPLNFKTFWINFADNSLTIGWGMVHPSGHLLSHPVHVPPQRLFIGFLSLDSPVVFRSIRLKKHLRSLLSVMPSPAGSLASHCLDTLAQNLTPESVCQLLCLLTTMWRTADPAWIRCVAYLAEHFAAVADAAPDAVCTLPAEALSEALACSRLNASEITIFCAIEAWALGRPVFLDAAPTPAGAPPPAARLAQCLPEITQALEHVRFPLMSSLQLQRVRASPLWRLIGTPRAYLPDDGRPQPHAGGRRGSLGCPPGLVQQPAQQRKAQVCLPQDLRRMWRHQRRAPANATELQFVHTRDKNGVLYHLGTNAGLNSRFVNPHLTGAVQAVCSSPFCSASDAGKLTSRVYHGDWCAHANSAGETFWQVDLKRHTVVCLEYVLRVNDSGAVPRGWVLQGANDAATWTDLHRVRDSTFFQSKGQYGVWRVEQPVMRPFSSIRLLLVGAASNGSRVLNVNFIDLYGYLMHSSAAH